MLCPDCDRTRFEQNMRNKHTDVVATISPVARNPGTIVTSATAAGSAAVDNLKLPSSSATSRRRSCRKSVSGADRATAATAAGISKDIAESRQQLRHRPSSSRVALIDGRRFSLRREFNLSITDSHVQLDEPRRSTAHRQTHVRAANVRAVCEFSA